MRKMGVYPGSALACIAAIATAAPGQTVDAPGGEHGTASAWSLSPASATPVTVSDLISMTTIGDRGPYGYGKEEDYSVVSPDGSEVAFVVQHGNLARNTVDFALVVARPSKGRRGFRPDTVARFASTSNRPAIINVRWLPDNATLVFLAEQPGGLPQVYTLDTRTRALNQRTHATAAIQSFDVAASGDPVIYAEEPTRDTSIYASMRAHGFVLSPKASVSDVIEGSWSDTPSWENALPRMVVVVRGGTEHQIALPDSSAGYQRCHVDQLSVGPLGDVALVPCDLRAAPPRWAGYQQIDYRYSAYVGVPCVDVVLDLTTDAARPLLDAPCNLLSSWVWAPDGQSIVLAQALLPLDIPDSAERSVRATHEMVAEVNVHSGAVAVVVHLDSVSVVAWDPRTSVIELAPGRVVSPSETRRTYYRRVGTGWVRMPSGPKLETAMSALVIERGLNAPPRVVAVNPRTAAREMVYDPNPGLFAKHRFGRETVVHWKTKAGTAWVGGLYWPPDYVPGRRYPLVIQTHDFDSTAFWPLGPYSSGYAAQPLANLGIMVLQVGMPPQRDQWLTSREAPLALEGAEAAIDCLDSLGLIDRARVGMQGFSRSGYHVLYFLTHSRYPVAAATVTESVDMSYLQYLIYGPSRLGLPGRGMMWEEKVDGGSPFGTAIKQWEERAPGFNLGAVTAPLRLTAHRSNALLGEWEPFAGLLLQGKPAELVYIPAGQHVLTKPWEQFTSQQGAVDWYRFWLKGEEDADSAKAEQYARWRQLRVSRDALLRDSIERR